MATSGPRPGLGKHLSAITILYVNATFECFGRPLRLSEPFVNWADLRYALESCFGTVSNSSTYLRGYTLDHTELNAKDLVPECLFVRRCVMPLGLRQYIPPEANVKYMKAKQDLAHVLLAIADESKAFEAYVNATDYTNYTEMSFERNPVFAKRKESLEDLLKTLEDKAGLHPSAFTEVPQCISSGDVEHQSSYVKPWPTYVCQTCMRVGLHFKDACYLFKDEPPVVKDVTFKWGAKKMKKFPKAP